MGELGRLLRQLRSSADLTQEELAERSGISARAISDLERGLRTSAYRDTAARLADALGLDESARGQLLAAARRDRVAPAPLPSPATSLIGRDDDVADVVGLLRSGTRLVTLLGPGGVGKTRLAIEVARAVGDAAFVELAATRDAHVVASLIARAIGVNPAREPVLDLVVARLQGTRLVLVLDTFEHVLDGAADVASLLARCPGVSVIVTSRSPLRIGGETIFLVRPLPVETGGAATRLFAERAHGVRPDVHVEPEAVADICRRLDGVPLAIELAAARVRHLPVSELGHRLHLALLGDGARDAPARHRTMHATIAWSYRLLDEPARDLLRKLSCFTTFTLEAAEAVDPGSDVLDLVAQLVDQSLVEPVAGAIEPPRYRLLDVVREFAAEECVASGQAEQAAGAHAAYFLALAERAAPELRRREHERWLRRLDDDLANLRLAEQRFIEVRDVDGALGLAAAMWMFWLWQGGFAEGRDWLRRALALDPDGGSPGHATALWAAGGLAFFTGDYDDLARRGEQLVAMAGSAKPSLDSRNGLTLRGMALLARLRFGEAAVAFGAALDACPADAPWQHATSLFNVGIARLHQRDDAPAESALADAEAAYAELGDDAYQARAVRQRAALALVRGDLQAAARLLRESLALTVEAGDAWGLAEAMEAIALHCAADADARGCATLLAVAGRLRDESGTRPYPFDVALADPYVDNVRRSDPAEWAEGTAIGSTVPLDAAAGLADGLLRTAG